MNERERLEAKIGHLAESIAAGLAWYKFGGHNLQAAYGYGTRDDADKYAAYLNRGRGVNMYGHQLLSEDDAEATRLAGSGLVDITAEGVNLADALAEIADA